MVFDTKFIGKSSPGMSAPVHGLPPVAQASPRQHWRRHSTDTGHQAVTARREGAPGALQTLSRVVAPLVEADLGVGRARAAELEALSEGL